MCAERLIENKTGDREVHQRRTGVDKIGQSGGLDQQAVVCPCTDYTTNTSNEGRNGVKI